jgi:protocatechuate 3,4-dioxygenase beta subunit
LDAASVRRDITEGLPGVRLTLSLRILRAGDCAASSGVAVDIWQCDADGVYSGYPGQLGGRNTSGEQFLRGTQVTDAEGVATFETIYPGWYPGRTTHIHFKVRATDPEDAASFREATSQLYFPEDVTALVYQSAPYASRGQKDTSNAADGLSRNELPPLLAVAQAGDGYTASLTVSIAL